MKSDWYPKDKIEDIWVFNRDILKFKFTLIWIIIRFIKKKKYVVCEKCVAIEEKYVTQRVRHFYLKNVISYAF